jgi:hypothetical protein
VSGEELEHVRRPNLPWRSSDLTECGLDTNRPTITREQLRAKWKRQGQQRAAMTTCMTCLSTARRWPSWDEDPVGCLGREAYLGESHGDAFRIELRAIALLIAAHREEFDQAVRDLNAAPTLDDLRRQRQRQAGYRPSAYRS